MQKRYYYDPGRRPQPRRPLGVVEAEGKRLNNKQLRAKVCAEAGVPNTGRQWRKLRKQIRRGER